MRQALAKGFNQETQALAEGPHLSCALRRSRWRSRPVWHFSLRGRFGTAFAGGPR